VAEITVKILLFCVFRRTGKAMGQVYQCLWRICREINVFSRFEHYPFYILHPFVTYLLTLSRINIIISTQSIEISIGRYCKNVKYIRLNIMEHELVYYQTERASVTDKVIPVLN
jgi:hypothetical protein